MAPRISARTESTLHLEGIDEPIRVVRSTRRTKTVSARRRAGMFEILIPARLSRSQEQRWAREMFEKYGQQHDAPKGGGDDELFARAVDLAKRYLPAGVTPVRVSWVTNQGTRWGSCTSASRTIRLSHELRTMPQYVQDAVMIHELAHLVAPDHGPQFRAIVEQNPDAARAEAFLAGVIHGRSG